MLRVGNAAGGGLKNKTPTVALPPASLEHVRSPLSVSKLDPLRQWQFRAPVDRIRLPAGAGLPGSEAGVATAALSLFLPRTRLGRVR
jgi:hypothetical protein